MLTGSKIKVQKQRQEGPLDTTEFDTVQLPPTGNCHLILADADSIGLSRAGPEFERSWMYDESNFRDLEAEPEGRFSSIK
jgi:hypothetical protein